MYLVPQFSAACGYVVCCWWLLSCAFDLPQNVASAHKMFWTRGRVVNGRQHAAWFLRGNYRSYPRVR
jgi:hypothetical protein